MHPVITLTVTKFANQIANRECPLYSVSVQYSTDGNPPFTTYTKTLAATDMPFAAATLLPQEVRSQIDATITKDGSVILGEVIKDATLSITTPASIITTKDLQLGLLELHAEKIALNKTVTTNVLRLEAEKKIDNLATLVSKKISIDSKLGVMSNYGQIVSSKVARISVGALYNHNKIIVDGELYTKVQKNWVNTPGASLVTTGKITINSKSSRGNILNFGLISTQGELLLNSKGTVANGVGGIINSNNKLHTTAALLMNAGYMHSTAENHIACSSTDCVVNTTDGVIDSAKDVTFLSLGALNNFGKIKGHETVDVLVSGDLNNLQNAAINADLRLKLSSAKSIINEALIGSNGSLDAIANHIVNITTGKITAKTASSIIALDTLQNAGHINAGELKAYVGSLLQTATGIIESAGNARIEAEDSRE